jgi:hypothetical protein
MQLMPNQFDIVLHTSVWLRLHAGRIARGIPYANRSLNADINM